MERLALFVAGLVSLAAFAGCLGADDEKDDRDDADAVPDLVFENGLLVQELYRMPGASEPMVVAKAAAGALSELVVSSEIEVEFSEDVLVYVDGRFVQGPVAASSGEPIRFLPPPGATNVTVTIPGIPDMEARPLLIETPYNATAEFVSGASAVHLERVQEDHFPHRTPGMPNYVASQQYFKAWFERHGYEVTIEPIPNTCAPVGGLCPSSVVNVVAYRQGTMLPERIIGFGGHYDMVTTTTHAAFDDTSGTVETLELARAFANVTTGHSLLFGLWGGEEDGLLGSNFWAHSNPQKVALMHSYVNLDVSAIAWPAPLPNPDPVISSSGPDGPVADRMNEAMARAWAAAAFPADMIQYHHVGSGQSEGGVDAQSDHTSFIAAGVPSTFLYTSNLTAAFGLIHSERDTLENLTVFAGTGLIPDDENTPLLEDELRPAAEEALAKSFATFQWTAFYYALQSDLTGWDPRTD